VSGSPPGYVGVAAAGASATALADLAPAVEEALARHGTLYAYAAAHPDRRELRGRAPAYDVPLGDARVVVRHSWHGGALAAATRDLFLPPTRAPRELATSERLRALGVRTPELVAYVRYPGPLGLERADVATRLVADGRDLAAVIRALPLQRDPTGGWVRAAGGLLHALAHAGARHPDLNLKNVLLTHVADAPADTAYDAWVLDVDVVELDAGPVDTGRAWALNERNLARLERSLRKWREHHALPVLALELESLRAVSRHGREARVEVIWRPGHNVGPT
jgi:hypothetical protein